MAEFDLKSNVSAV